MELPEQADSSAERIIKPNVIGHLEDEQARAGSTLEYVRQLGEWYLGQGDHHPNMKQLQRMAGAITNPVNEPTYPSELTNAFYWGEILAYRAQDILSEGEWAQVSYKLFSAAMGKHAQIAKLHFSEPQQHPRTGEWSVQELSHTARLRGIGDMIIGQLEELDSEFMPQAMEEFIISISEELDARPEDRWYMILGFRHITSQVVEASVNAQMREDGARMTDEERKALAKELKKEERARKALRKQFLKLMDKAEIDDVQGRELVHIDEIREQIMESYADHVLAYGNYDEKNEAEIDKLTLYLSQVMNQDFDKLESVAADDFLRIGGHAAIITFNENEESETIRMLGKDEFIEGTVQGIAIGDTPAAERILQWRDGRITVGELEENTNVLGVMMMLKDPVLINSADEHVQAGENRMAGIIMTNPDMTISKYLL